MTADTQQSPSDDAAARNKTTVSSSPKSLRMTAALALAGAAVGQLGYTLYVLTQIRPYHPWFYSVLGVPPVAWVAAYFVGRRRANSGKLLLFLMMLALVALATYYVHWYNRMWPGFCCGE